MSFSYASSVFDCSCPREETHVNSRKMLEDAGLTNQCTTTILIQSCANFSSMEAVGAMPTSKFLSSKIHSMVHLINYFTFVCRSVHSVQSCVQTLTSVSAVRSRNVSDRSFLISVKSEKYTFWVTLRPLGSIRQSEA